MKNWFEDVKTVEGAKKMYRKLAMQYHPDHGGNAEVFKEINSQFERLLDTLMFSAFNDYEQKKGKEAYGNAFVFSDILKKVIHFNVTIEIIGYWIYCFDSYEYKDTLKEMGFWFSNKHKAWVYSGMKKTKRATKMQIDNIRGMHGNQVIKEKESTKQITA